MLALETVGKRRLSNGLRHSVAADIQTGSSIVLVDDDTPFGGILPATYPRNPPVNLPTNLYPRHFYAFEGIDGSGKSTLIREAMRILRERKRPVTMLKLGRSELTAHALPRALWVNADPVTLNLLNWVSVFDQLCANARVLDEGSLVLFDRFVLTIKVRGLLEGLGTGFMDAIEALVPRPRLTFMIECDPALCAQRILDSGRTITYFEAGSRIVARLGQPMMEKDPSARCASYDRAKGLLAHLTLMQVRMAELVAGYDNVVRIENSGSIGRALDEIVCQIETIVGSG